MKNEKGSISNLHYPRIFKGNIEWISKPKANSKKSQSLFDTAEYQLSVIIPAYNEEKRLKTMLDDAVQVLNAKVLSDQVFKCEVILVDDGSKDKTVSEYKRIISDFGHLQGIDFKLIKMMVNSGKGRAVSEVKMCTILRFSRILGHVSEFGREYSFCGC